ncbi:MAG: helix-turn-helix domain-containing protein [Coriobacteriales bacterium]
MQVAEMRKQTGLSQRQYAECFGIPVRTLQQWEQNKSTPPSYVISMMERLSPELARRHTPAASRHVIPERRRWRVCIDRPFENCNRIYPVQQRKVRELIDDISADPAVKSITVFGSSVTQRCHIGSDVDVYVETDDTRSPISMTHDFAFDLWTNHTADERLKDEIARTGVKVYG